MSIDNRFYVPSGAKTHGPGYPRTKYKCGDAMPPEQQTPHQVHFCHGGAFAIDDQFFFESPDDARWYCDEAYKDDLLHVAGGTVEDGSVETEPQSLTLWIDGEEFHGGAKCRVDE